MLNPMTFQNIYKDPFTDWVLMDDADDLSGRDQNYTAVGTFDPHEAFAEAYSDYASEGVLFGVDLDSVKSQATSRMLAELRKVKSPVVANNTIIARAVCTYWDTFQGTIVQDLFHGGIAPIDVNNNAMSFVAPMALAIKTSSNSKRRTAFSDLIKVTERFVKVIVFNVVELFPAGSSTVPITFVETIK